MVGRQWGIDPETVFWRWPIAKCWLCVHVHWFLEGVTCRLKVNIDSIIEKLQRLNDLS